MPDGRVTSRPVRGGLLSSVSSFSSEMNFQVEVGPRVQIGGRVKRFFLNGPHAEVLVEGRKFVHRLDLPFRRLAGASFVIS